MKKIVTIYEAMLILSLMVLINLLKEGQSFSVGVPPIRSVCTTMTPQHHHYPPQGTESPFVISVNRNTISGGNQIFVTLLPGTDKGENRTISQIFIGFYIQARRIDDDKPIGMFSPNSKTKVHSCGGLRANAAHHASGGVKKENVTVVWTAPNNYFGDVVLTATVLKDFVTYWVFLESEPVTIIKQESYQNFDNQRRTYSEKVHISSGNGNTFSSFDKNIVQGREPSLNECNRHVLLLKRFLCVLFSIRVKNTSM